MTTKAKAMRMCIEINEADLASAVMAVQEVGAEIVSIDMIERDLIARPEGGSGKYRRSSPKSPRIGRRTTVRIKALPPMVRESLKESEKAGHDYLIKSGIGVIKYGEIPDLLKKGLPGRTYGALATIRSRLKNEGMFESTS